MFPSIFRRITGMASAATLATTFMVAPAFAQWHGGPDHRGPDHRPPPPHYEHGRPGWHGGPPRGNGGAVIGGALLGLGVGAVVGSLLAPPPVVYAPPPAYYPPAPPPVYYGY